MNSLGQDLRHAIRFARRNPILTLIATVSFAISIGTTTAVLNVADALLLRDPTGVADPDRLVDIGFSRDQRGFGSGSYPNYLDIRDRATTLDGVYAQARFPVKATLEANTGVEAMFVMPVTSNYFSVLGAIPAAGRFFATTGQASTETGIVLSHGFWSRRFNADPSVVGRTIVVNGAAQVILGVAAPGFQGTGVRSPDGWTPMAPSRSRAGAYLIVGGRLRPGVSIEQASAEVATIGAVLAREYPADNEHVGFLVAALSSLPGESRPVAALLAFLLVIVASVLLVACVNVAGALIARAVDRRKEMATRLALGASRAQLVRQLIAETAAFAVPGGFGGVLLAGLVTTLAVSALPSLPFPVHVSLSMNLRAVGVALALAAIAALASSLAPALQASRTEVSSELAAGATAGRRQSFVRRSLVSIQIALAIFLVAVGGLFTHALRHATSGDPGFDPAGVELVSANLSLARVPPDARPALAHTLWDRVRTLPSVESSTVAAVLPGGFEGIGLGSISRIDEPAKAVSAPVWNLVEPQYFLTLRMPILAGRDFTAADRKGTAPVVILGEGAAHALWPDRPAVGQEVRRDYWDGGPKTQTLRVVGITRDPKLGSLVDGGGAYAYLPLQQEFLDGWPLLVVTRGARGRSAFNDVSAVIASLAPDLPAVSMQRATEYVDIGLAPQRIVATFSSALGLIGMLLAAFGLYGAVSYAVARRTRELGVRLALGATRAHVIRLVLGQTAAMAAIGLATGVMLAAGVGQLLSGFLLGIPPVDPWAFGGALLLFGLAGSVACAVPTRRAVRISPTEAIRSA